MKTFLKSQQSYLHPGYKTTPYPLYLMLLLSIGDLIDTHPCIKMR
jgi:hypothetical protein